MLRRLAKVGDFLILLRCGSRLLQMGDFLCGMSRSRAERFQAGLVAFQKVGKMVLKASCVPPVMIASRGSQEESLFFQQSKRVPTPGHDLIDQLGLGILHHRFVQRLNI